MEAGDEDNSICMTLSDNITSSDTFALAFALIKYHI